MKEAKSFLKSGKGIVFIIISLALLGIFYGVGSNTAKADIEGERLTYNELLERIDEQNTEIHKLNDEIEETEEEKSQVEQDLSSKKGEYDEVIEVINSKEDVESEISTLNDDIETKEGQIKELHEEIKDLNSELQSLTGEIKEAKGKPVTLSAGFFTVGKDIPAGRYKVTPNGNGNFFVNSGASVNIMLGNGEFYESEYVFEAYEGDEIELTLSATFTPVE